jgi:hypothetical protein
LLLVEHAVDMEPFMEPLALESPFIHAEEGGDLRVSEEPGVVDEPIAN